MQRTSMRTIGTFRRDERGATAIIFGLIVTVLFVTVGGAIDFGRWYHARQMTIAAVDAAVLAAGRTLQLDPDNTSGAVTMAQKIYTSNVSDRMLLASDTINFTVTDAGKAVTAQGTAYIGTTLLAVAGITQLPIMTASGTGFPKARLAIGGNGGSNLEIAMVLDVTGSMCANGVGPCTSDAKMTALKDAAKELVNIVVWSNQTTYTSRVAIVPFSTRIRVGPNGGGGGIMQTLTNLPPTWSGWYKMCVNSSGGGDSETSGNWTCNGYDTQEVFNWKIMPCVTDRMYSYSMDNFTTAYDYTDRAPGGSRWLNAHGGDRMPFAEHSSNGSPSSGRGTETDPATNWNYDGAGGCADVAEANEVMPLSADKSALIAKINGLEAYGSTSGALGASWGWYMLSPEWSSIWTGESTPGPYSDITTIQSNGSPKLRKVAVILSDGVFNTLRGWKDQDQQFSSTHAANVCAAMKAAKIEIYTVGFALDQLPSGEQAIARSTLQACGTDLSHFYETVTLPELKQAFVEIGLQLSSLYLSK